jgi:ornithine cyclodeaminase
MLLVTTHEFKQLIQQIGLSQFTSQLINQLEKDFSRWETFKKSPRHATHYPHGVIELMPCADDAYYSFKYVNGHPQNTAMNKLCVAALGQLSEVSSGYPLMLSEMTWLTAIRTAATAALGAKYLARADSKKLAIVGCGAQAEFQLIALASVLPVTTVYYFDIASAAMRKFEKNVATMQLPRLTLIPASSIDSCLEEADVVVTATACKSRQQLITSANLRPGMHIHAMGGDCPGKTEISRCALDASKIFVEYLEQTREEGDIQQLTDHSSVVELWKVITKARPGRTDEQDITLFDSVGFALEDYSALCLTYRLCEEYGIGQSIDMIPELGDPKDLYVGLVN